MLDWLYDWLTSAIAWIWDTLKEAFLSLFDLIYDAALYVFNEMLRWIATAFEVIDPPQWLTDNNMGQLFSGLHPDIVYFVGQLGFASGFVMLGGAITFRMMRKLVTLFQW